MERTSVLIIRANDPRLSWRRVLAMSMLITPALQPMPERLKVFTLSRIAKRLTMMEESEGEEQKALQLSTRMSIS